MTMKQSVLSRPNLYAPLLAPVVAPAVTRKVQDPSVPVLFLCKMNKGMPTTKEEIVHVPFVVREPLLVYVA